MLWQARVHVIPRLRAPRPDISRWSMATRVIETRRSDDEDRVRRVPRDDRRTAFGTEAPTHLTAALRCFGMVLRLPRQPQRPFGNEQSRCVGRSTRSLTVSAMAIDGHERLCGAHIPDRSACAAAGEWELHVGWH